MAKFVYRMENILNIKYKLEEQAKQEYMTVRVRLNEEEEKLNALQNRKQEYFAQYRDLLKERLDVLQIETCKEADEYIAAQEQVVARVEEELEQAIAKMKDAIKERKIHEKLKEKQFEIFLQELNQEEMKEIDQLISYQYNHSSDQEE